MPAYQYQCIGCQKKDIRIGGVDDHLAVCSRCGRVMLRLDLDVFAPYFDHEERRALVSGAKNRE